MLDFPFPSALGSQILTFGIEVNLLFLCLKLPARLPQSPAGFPGQEASALADGHKAPYVSPVGPVVLLKPDAVDAGPFAGFNRNLPGALVGAVVFHFCCHTVSSVYAYKLYVDSVPIT